MKNNFEIMFESDQVLSFANSNGQGASFRENKHTGSTGLEWLDPGEIDSESENDFEKYSCKRSKKKVEKGILITNQI